MKICAATGNAGKLRELRRILEAQGHEVVSQKELGITLEPEETGTTFAANALIKAETICKASGMATIPDECGVGKTGKRPNTEGRSYAQLTPDEKDAISHRGNALAKLEEELPKFLAK